MPIEQMNISLPPQMARYIRGKVKAGEYTNASEVVRDAVRHMQSAEEDRRQRALLQAFEAEDEVALAGIREGVSQLEAGAAVDLDGDAALQGYFSDVVSRGRARLAQKAKARKK